MTQPESVPLESLLAHTGWVRGLALRVARNRADADDLEQETWLRILRAPPRRSAGLRAWIKVVLSNAFRDTRRSESRRTYREEAVARPNSARSTEVLVAEAELHHRVASEVLRLPEPYRSVLLRRYYQGLPPRSIAERTGLPVETVHTQLKRARKRLRSALQERSGREQLGTLGLAPAANGWISKGAILVSASTKKWAALSGAVLLLIGGVVAVNSLSSSDAPRPQETPGALQTSAPTLESKPVRKRAPGPSTERVPEARVGRLHVRVTKGEGQPVAGAAVNVYPGGLRQRIRWLDLDRTYDDPMPAHSATTDVRGEARFDALRVGGWVVVATSPGFAPSGVSLPRFSADGELTIDLRLEPGGRVAGRVFDAEGRTVADALVIASRTSLGRFGAVEVRARSTREGEYAFEDLPPGVLSLEVRAPRHAVHRVGSIVAPMARGFDIHLPRTGRVVGRLLGPSGAPVPDAQVELHMWARGFAETSTDHEGRFELFTEKPIRSAFLTARVRGFLLDPGQPYYHLASAYIGSCLDIPPPAVGETRHVEMRLIKGARLQGRVLGPNGPLAGARVRVVTIGTEAAVGAFGTETNAEGHYVLEGLPAGLLLVRAEHESYTIPGLPRDGVRLHAVRSGATDPLSVTLGAGATGRLDITLEKGAVITGRVVTSDGKPVAGASVWAGQPVETREVANARSAADGTFTLDPVDLTRKGWVSVRHPHFLPHCVAVKASDENRAEVTLELHAFRVARGRVTSESGDVPEGTVVRLVSYGASNRQELFGKFVHAPKHDVGGDGSFELRVPVLEGALGGLWIRAGAPGYADATLGPLKVKPNEPISDIRIALARGHDVELVVTEQGGAPIPGASVVLVSYDDENNLYEPRAYRDPTDAHGSTTLRVLPDGRFFADVSARGFAPAQVEWVLPGPTRIAVPLVRAARIEGRVRAETGASPAGARLELSPLEVTPRRGPGIRPSPTPGEAFVQADGRFVVDGLAAGRYRVVVSPPAGSTGLGVVTLESVETGTHDLSITLPAAGIIVGRVRDPAGYPAKDVVVRALAEETKSGSWKTTTKPDGTFEIGGLRSERFVVRVETPRWGKLGAFAWMQQSGVEPGGSELNFILVRGATIEGRVVDGTGKGVPGLPIGSHAKWVITGESGAFVLRGLRKGKHRIRVQSWANSTGFQRLLGADAIEAGARGVELRAAR